MERKQLIDMSIMRTKAWVAEVGMVRGTESTPLSPVELMGVTWGSSGFDFRFDKWVSGKNHVSDTALKLVDTELAAMKLPSCIDVYTNGPEGLPFWTLLSDAPESYPEEMCKSLIADSLYPREKGMETKRIAFGNKPFSVMIEDLWKLLVGDLRADFAGYDSGEEGNALYIRIETGKVKPSLDLFAQLLAVRQLAERRRECRETARYLSDACFGMLHLFDPWNIRNEVAGILDSWYAPSNPVAIAIIDRSLESPYWTPYLSGAAYRHFIESHPK
jgi:hypothetical protein